MAEATRYTNVIVPTTGQTITGPLDISTIKVVGGGSGATVTITNPSTAVIFKSVVANNSSEITTFNDEFHLRSDTYTVNVTAGAADIYIYII